MALQKQSLQINFAQGLDTKTDPNQVSIGKFQTLVNSVFDKLGRLTKRNGYPKLTALSNSLQTTLTTLNDNLLATGSNLYAYNQDTDQWLNQGTIQPVQLDTLPLVRVSTSQSSPDTAVASNGLTCLVYIDTAVAYYQISDSVTGQQVVGRTAIASTAVAPRVFLLNKYFIITYLATVGGSPHLQYIAIPVTTPTSPGTAKDFSTSVSGLTAGYDGVVANNTLYMAWAGAGTTVKIAALRYSNVNSGTPPSAVSIASHTSTLMSVTADTSGSNPVIWIAYWDSSSTNGYVAAFSYILATILASTKIIDTVSINEITAVATDSALTVFYENANTYRFAADIYNVAAHAKTDFITKNTVTSAGVVGTSSVILRSTGLASKAFLADSGDIYMLVTYGETNQPTYFLIDSLGNVYMRLAAANGGGYEATQVLPTISLVDDTYYVPYQIKDFLASVNKNTNLPSGTPTSAIYTQTGINLAKFTINSTGQYSSQIASALHLTGGQLWMYDAVKPVEHGFQVYPENVAAIGSSTVGAMTVQKYFYVFTYEWTDNQGNLHRSAPSIPFQYEIVTPPANFTANRTSGSPILAAVSSAAGLQIGQVLSGTGIPAGAYITTINLGSSTITMSANATSGSATSTTITPTVVTSVTCNVPTLRLTYKTSPNPVRIVGYRWSTAQQVYYQFTSLTSPTANNPAVDSVAITDSQSDAQILGNTLLYTTGGVIENIAAPACTDSVLYKNRLFLIDAEDPNLLWYSKQVIQGVPVEMSDLLTLYIAPTSGAQGSTGKMRALGAMDDKLIVFKKDAIYYLTGNGPDNTGANNDFSDPIYITSSVGCSNPNSVVLTPNGVMFQSDKGIWLLGRDLNTSYIGAAVEQYNSSTVLSAQAIPATNQVRFILDTGITLMYDYYVNQWGTFSNLSAISATLHESLHAYLAADGSVYQESPGTYLDGSSPVLMSFKTSWINAGGLQGYERFYQMYLLGEYASPFKLNVQLSYDYNPANMQNTIVLPDNFGPVYGDSPVWGSPGFWGGPARTFEARVFPQQQKCESFQVSMQEIYDPSYSVAAGAGLTLSGLNLVIGVKKGYRTQKSSQSFG